METRHPLTIPAAIVLGTAVVADPRLTSSPHSTESIPDTLLEVLKDL